MGSFVMDLHICKILHVILWGFRFLQENIINNKITGLCLNLLVMPKNISVMHSVIDRKMFLYWFQNLNPTTCCVLKKMTQEGLKGKKAYRQMLTKIKLGSQF